MRRREGGREKEREREQEKKIILSPGIASSSMLFTAAYDVFLS